MKLKDFMRELHDDVPAVYRLPANVPLVSFSIPIEIERGNSRLTDESCPRRNAWKPQSKPEGWKYPDALEIAASDAAMIDGPVKDADPGAWRRNPCDLVREAAESWLVRRVQLKAQAQATDKMLALYWRQKPAFWYAVDENDDLIWLRFVGCGAFVLMEKPS